MIELRPVKIDKKPVYEFANFQRYKVFEGYTCTGYFHCWRADGKCIVEHEDGTLHVYDPDEVQFTDRSAENEP